MRDGEDSARDAENEDKNNSREDGGAQPSTDDSVDLDSIFGELITAMHGNSFVGLVTNRTWLAERANRLCGWPRPRTLQSKDFGYRISFSVMQRVLLRQLQWKLINITTSLESKDELTGEHPELAKLLPEYIQAVRDYEYMKKFSGQTYDPFIVSSERYHERELLGEALDINGLDLFTTVRKKEEAIPTGPWEKYSPKGQVPIGGTRPDAEEEALYKAFWRRMAGAVLGGAFLVGPMWLFILHRNLVFLLGGTTVCVFLFGALTTFLVNSPGDVFTATLAYAAVLMVFVGVTIEESAEG